MPRRRLCRYIQGRQPGLLELTWRRTTDTSFVDNPPTSSRSTSKYQTPGPAGRQSRMPPPSTRGTTSTRGSARGGRGSTRGAPGTRPSGLARARGRGVR
ncbi:hypothetical protein BT67DRAFT_156789 [Trichocladium antarcticum]|uniref:Uncharacterized protein n=1 Tax=Trichocladium antarcticum TaxID=1450529 RepID=A0AAN6UEH4_9PEZI|nr:hypothetical protein BT67DRAFT_156789 [Trichocladium antarcticum]